MPAKILPIVEGPGDVSAVPLLLRRIAEALDIFDLQVVRPIRCPRHRLVKGGEFERVLDLAVRKAGRDCQILVLIDANSDCPRVLAPILIERAQIARNDIRTNIVLAKMEYEAWFLGAIASLLDNPPASSRTPVLHPEDVRGAKERLSTLLNEPYAEVVDQPSLTARFDMLEARRNCPSFDKCWRSVESILTASQDP